MKIFFSELAPKPIGPYSQAIQSGNTVYVSGQIAMDPETGELIHAEIDRETRIVLEHIKNILESGNISKENIVKCSIFLKNMGDFKKVNDAYAAFFGKHAPAREAVEVSELPKGARVEISCIAAV